MSEFLKRSFEMRANKESEKAILIGRPIVYDSRTNIGGMFEEIIMRGALDNANLKDIKFLINHNTDMIPLARYIEGDENSTMRISIDDKGLFIELELDIENNAEARALYFAVKRGDIKGMSFMFSIRSEKWEDENTDLPTRKITEIEQVLEVSAVTFPAYEQTEISARDKKALEKIRKKVIKPLLIKKYNGGI